MKKKKSPGCFADAVWFLYQLSKAELYCPKCKNRLGDKDYENWKCIKCGGLLNISLDYKIK